MFINGEINNYKTNLLDESLHSGIPKRYYSLKTKTFGEWEIPPWELWIFWDRLLGEGTFSQVYLAKWRETFVVAKVFKQEILSLKKQLILREIDTMTRLHHPNITQFLGYIDEPFIIVLEYIPNNNLQDNIKNLSKKQKYSIIKDILRGLAYIHNRLPVSLIHRDIKPTNILLTNSKVAKIADFGLSRFYNLTNMKNSNNNILDISINQNTHTDTYTDTHTDTHTDTNTYLDLDTELTSYVGTARYMAPEINSKIGYTNKIDIYACGIVFYEMFENKIYKPSQGFSWFWTPKKIKDIIINYMTCTNPNDRLDAIRILQMLNNS